MNVRFCRNGHSTQLKNAYFAYIWQISEFVRSYFAYIWQTSSAKHHFEGMFLVVLANRPAIYK